MFTCSPTQPALLEPLVCLGCGAVIKMQSPGLFSQLLCTPVDVLFIQIHKCHFNYSVYCKQLKKNLFECLVCYCVSGLKISNCFWLNDTFWSWYIFEQLYWCTFVFLYSCFTVSGWIHVRVEINNAFDLSFFKKRCLSVYICSCFDVFNSVNYFLSAEMKRLYKYLYTV